MDFFKAQPRYGLQEQDDGENQTLLAGNALLRLYTAKTLTPDGMLIPIPVNLREKNASAHYAICV